VLVDTEAPEPQLEHCLADLNPLHEGGDRLPEGSAESTYRRARQAGSTFYALTSPPAAPDPTPPASAHV
jgi:hypothetical protein